MGRPLITCLLLATVALCGCKKSETPAESDSSPPTPTKAAAPTEPVELKLKWPVGAHYTQRMDLQQNVETRMAGMPQAMKQDVEMSQDFGLSVIADRPEGGREIEMDFLSMQMNVSAGDRVLLSFDSGGESLDGDKNPMAELFRNLVGTRIKFILDASNQLVRLEGLQEFRNRVLTNSPAQARSSMSQMLSEDYFKQMINFGQGLPPHPVRPGDSWPVKTDIAMGPLGVMELDLQYVFKGYEQRDQRQCALLEFNGVMKSRPGREPANPNMTMAVEGGTTSGKSWFDPDLGMVIGADVDQDMKMNITLAGQKTPDTNQAPTTRSMSTAIKQKIKLSIQPNSAAK